MMPIQATGKIWMDGEYVDWDEARVHILTPSLHYGWGVFEGIRAYETADGGSAVFPLTSPVRMAIASWPWGAYLGEDSFETGVRVKISSWRRLDPNIIPPAAKATGQYLNSSLAKAEAVKAGYDEGILLNPNGYVTDGSGENVFLVRDGVLSTPPLAAGCLAGITRASILQIAEDEGIPVREGDLVRTDLYR